MILVKFWFWSFLFFLDAASVRQRREFEKTEFDPFFYRRAQRHQRLSPLFPPPARDVSELTPVHIGNEPGRTSLRSETMARQGPAFQNIEPFVAGAMQGRRSTLNLQPSTMEPGGTRSPPLPSSLRCDAASRYGATSCPTLSAVRYFLPPLTGLEFLLDNNPGRRSPTRFALGYYLSGLQPCKSVSIGVHPW